MCCGFWSDEHMVQITPSVIFYNDPVWECENLEEAFLFAFDILFYIALPINTLHYRLMTQSIFRFSFYRHYTLLISPHSFLFRFASNLVSPLIYYQIPNIGIYSERVDAWRCKIIIFCSKSRRIHDKLFTANSFLLIRMKCWRTATNDLIRAKIAYFRNRISYSVKFQTSLA